MSLYPPLTQANLAELNAAIGGVDKLHRELELSSLPYVDQPGDEDHLAMKIAEFRGRVRALDTALFRLFGLIHRLRVSNLPKIDASSPPTRRPVPKPTLDTLEDMFR